MSASSGSASASASGSNNPNMGSYPLPAHLPFYPGGLFVKDHEKAEAYYDLASYSHSTSTSTSLPSPPSSSGSRNTKQRRVLSPDVIVQRAHLADVQLRRFALYYDATTAGDDQKMSATPLPHVLPSLSALAEAAFDSLTGVPPTVARKWADAMVLQYFSSSSEPDVVPSSEEEAYNSPLPTSSSSSSSSTEQTTPQMLKSILQQSPPNQSSGGTRPCGYVFQRGDIAWNCRTCQTDATCVLCDACFRNSDHEGHEVFFHRTTPGGCCDCGDAEAWKVEGCCPLHRPTVEDVCTPVPSQFDGGADVEEAVKMALKGRTDGLETLVDSPSTALPPRLKAALGVVIGAAVKCLVKAVEGAGIGADPIQWKLKWADDACRIYNGASSLEEFYYQRVVSTVTGTATDEEYPSPPQTSTPQRILNRSEPQTLPPGYRLHLRLHNDDVHTFDEVIDALYESASSQRARSVNNVASRPSLVPLRDDAESMTHHVDADGQVVVKLYTNAPAAMSGYRRLKSRGLHCAVVGTAQFDLEQRAKVLATWLAEISAAHPAAAVLVVNALVQTDAGRHGPFGDVHVWEEARMIPSWVGLAYHKEQMSSSSGLDDIELCRKRFRAFPPHLASSYVSREEAEKLHRLGLELNPSMFVSLTATDPNFYSTIPYRLPSERYVKSPHTLWGTLPSVYSDNTSVEEKHPLLKRLVLPVGQDVSRVSVMENLLTEDVLIVDTDLRKQQEADKLTSSVYPHKLPGLHMVSGLGIASISSLDKTPPPIPSPMEWRHLLATTSFRAPVSPILLLLLLDPYPTKQARSSIHALFLSLLVDARFKCRFAAALGAVAYRPLSTLFCAGVGTEADSPLGFTVQIFTAGSLVRALGNPSAAEKLLRSDDDSTIGTSTSTSPVGIFSLPIGLTVVRCIHTNLLGATKEVHMILNNTAAGNDDDTDDTDVVRNTSRHENLLPALTYCPGEHPWTTLLPAATDDCFLDSRSTRHKRLPHLLRDLEYVIETPGTAIGLLLPPKIPIQPMLPFSSQDAISFPTMWARLLRLAQGMDPQKRKISGGHVEYEQNRWLEAFGLSLNFAGTRDALAESPTNSSSAAYAPVSADGSHLMSIRDAMGSLFAALLRELKLWLYREGMLETGLPLPPGGSHGGMDLSQVEALQRSTLHVSSSQLGLPLAVEGSVDGETGIGNSVNAVALSCATGVKMTEAQLELLESALRMEEAQYQKRGTTPGSSNTTTTRSGPLMGDWLRVPHSPLSGDSLSFHLPLHRALAKSVRTLCSVVVPESVRNENPKSWWKLPVLDEEYNNSKSADHTSLRQHPLVALIRPTLRSSNCRVVWSAGPECSKDEEQKRRPRAKNVSAAIAAGKIIHTIADHPIRCIAAAQQIERHLWARNGSSTAGMALNYSSAPLCRSFRDLDLTLVQLSASGLSIGLGARRVFALLISRFSMDGYLCDPERRVQGNSSSPPPFGSGMWVNPPRLQDPDHAVALSESFFSTLCVLVTELPHAPPVSPSDDISLKSIIKRELLHALAAEPRSHSEAMEAASSAVSRRDESSSSAGSSGGAGVFREAFAEVLRQIGSQKNLGSSRAASGPAAFELKAEYCNEYDPTFFHLRRQEHQHAMDYVARLRRQKTGNKEESEAKCLPVVCGPPKAHPRFLPSRLLLHLQPMDAAIRRYLLFALTGGSWLPPAEPAAPPQDASGDDEQGESSGVTTGHMIPGGGVGASSAIPVTTFSRRSFHRSGSSSSTFRKSSFNDGDAQAPFSASVVSASSVSILEVLQLLTLQVHTLEECASLHRTQADLDDEAKSLSASLSINSYLRRLIHVPESMLGVWALRPFPHGPLPSKGSGENRGSTLGLLIALYENRADHGQNSSGHGSDAPDEGHGGARSLTTSGLKWLLRFVNALVDGATSVSAASQSATNGVQINSSGVSESAGSWTIDEAVRTKIIGMLRKLPDLWPEERKILASQEADKLSAKNKEARKAAQMRVMAMMKKKQNAFAAHMESADGGSGSITSGKVDNEDEDEADLCIICRCDDTDGETNGPLGYLGHVQRSRAAQMRTTKEGTCIRIASRERNELFQTYRVVGDSGCQLRETEAMDSAPLARLPIGSVVKVLKSKVSDQYDLLSRRILVRHVDSSTGEKKATEGWASIQSSTGYVILSPLSTLCFTNGRWGSTRPIIRQCGHAAHLRCVEAHTLSLHSRAAGEQPYDGRFAANIEDGEFLCPLCKQLSNILIPRDLCIREKGKGAVSVSPDASDVEMNSNDDQDNQSDKPVTGTMLSLKSALTSRTSLSRAKELDTESDGHKALRQFGAHLLQAMIVPWERATNSQKRKQRRWYPPITRWDYEEEDGDGPFSSRDGPSVKNVLRLLRQQHIAWAAVGHSAASAEASARGVEEVLPFGVFSKTSDPWIDFNTRVKDDHPSLLEMKRTLTSASGLLEILVVEMMKQLGSEDSIVADDAAPVVGKCLADILDGQSWILNVKGADQDKDLLAQWSGLTALLSAIPCHTARDGMISQRHEARAAASAMWTVKGLGTDGNKRAFDEEDEDNSSKDAPTPLAIKELQAGHPQLPSRWGTMDPFVDRKEQGASSLSVPFRPGIASAFLYIPLLAWDLNTLAGAVFSSLLAADASDLPTSEDLLMASKVLIVGRIVQAIVTPCGYALPDSCDEDDDEEHWSKSDIRKEGIALQALVTKCEIMLKARSLDSNTPAPSIVEGADEQKSSQLFQSISQAIVPFARTVVLLLRASTSIIRQRQRSDRNGLEEQKMSEEDKLLESFVCDPEIMECEDGLRILQGIGGPLPSTLLNNSQETTNEQSWWPLINRWIVAINGIELYHGSRGKSIISEIIPGFGASGAESNALQDVSDSADGEKENTTEEKSSQSSTDNALPKADADEATRPASDMVVPSNVNESESIASEENEGDSEDGDDGDVDEDEYDEDTDMEDADSAAFVQGRDFLAGGVDIIDDSDDEMEIDVEEEAAGFFVEAMAEASYGAAGRAGVTIEDSSEKSSVASNEGDKESVLDRGFAYVSRAPILPYQPSLLGLEDIGAGPRGVSFEYSAASSVMCDLSYLGMIHRKDSPVSSLIRLPKSFVELYNLVNGQGMDDADDTSSSETAVCLLTGSVMRAGSVRRSQRSPDKPPGACTLHARKVGSGIGIFFLVQKCTVLLMHNNKSAYSPSLFVDEHGEEDPGLRRGRPLFLNDARYRALETMWRQQGIPREVAQIRSTSDRVIRDNWY